MTEHPHDKLQPDTPAFRPGLAAVDQGEWAGWYHWQPADPFEDHAGPFYCRPDEESGGAGVVCGWIAGDKNRNSGGNIHGGALMTFADFALFMIAGGMTDAVHGVTVTMNCEFVGAGVPGRLLTASGEVVRAGLSLVFVRGTIRDGTRAVLAFSGTIKRLERR